MGFRFRKSFRVAPGIRLNLSKGGTSWTLGRRGASLNVGGKQDRATVGIPGTGMSYTTPLEGASQGPQESGSGGANLGLIFRAVALLAALALIGLLALA